MRLFNSALLSILAGVGLNLLSGCSMCPEREELKPMCPDQDGDSRGRCESADDLIWVDVYGDGTFYAQATGDKEAGCDYEQVDHEGYAEAIWGQDCDDSDPDVGSGICPDGTTSFWPYEVCVAIEDQRESVYGPVDCCEAADAPEGCTDDTVPDYEIPETPTSLYCPDQDGDSITLCESIDDLVEAPSTEDLSGYGHAIHGPDCDDNDPDIQSVCPEGGIAFFVYEVCLAIKDDHDAVYGGDLDCCDAADADPDDCSSDTGTSR